MSKRLSLLLLVCFLFIIMLTACADRPDEDYVPFTETPSTTTAAQYSSVTSVTTTTTTVTTTTKTTVTEVSPTSTTVTTAATTTTKASTDAPGVYKPNRKTKYYIVVHIGSQSVAVYGKDKSGKYNQLAQCFTCSTGTKGHDTPKGSFTITKRYRWRLLVGDVYGQYSCRFASSYLFHSVPYKKQKASTLDNAEYDKLGSPASHGCVRLCVRDCKWIYDNCENGTQVYITKDSGPKGAGVPKRNTDKKYNGWDPSDKWSEGNPYFAESAKTTEKTAEKTTQTTATTTEKPVETTAQTTETQPDEPAQEPDSEPEE